MYQSTPTTPPQFWAWCGILIVSTTCIASRAIAGVDDFEDLSPGTIVTSRIIDGVTVTLSTDNARRPFRVGTYGDPNPILAFSGLNDQDNAPLNPGNVSGSQFISTLTNDPPFTGFDSATPITFTFSQPVVSFELTTLDVLEEGVSSDVIVLLRAFDDSDTEMDTRARFGPQGPSGLDLRWRVDSPAANITKAILTQTNGSTAPFVGYGIDDLKLNTEQAVPGDANWDRKVDAGDLNILALNWQKAVEPSTGPDFNDDGFVNASDLNVLALNWQFGVDQPSLVSLEDSFSIVLATVPEPGAVSLWALIGSRLLLGRRRWQGSLGAS